MKEIHFTLFGHGSSKEQAEAELTELCKKLQAICKDANLELTAKYLMPIMNAGVYDRKDGYKGGWQAFYHLVITKTKEHTYNDIYKMVNSVKICSFTVI